MQIGNRIWVSLLKNINELKPVRERRIPSIEHDAAYSCLRCPGKILQFLSVVVVLIQ